MFVVVEITLRMNCNVAAALDRQCNLLSTEADATHSLTEDCDSVIFSPPLYKQRYDLAAGILREDKITSVCFDDCFSKIKTSAVY